MAPVLRIILIIVVVYYLIRLIDRYIVPYLFGTPEERIQGKKDKDKWEDAEDTDYEEID